MTDSIHAQPISTKPGYKQEHSILLNGASLSLEDVAGISLKQSLVELDPSLYASERLLKSCQSLQKIMAKGHKIYGVNTLFGGLANQEAADPDDLQQQLLMSHMAGAGEPLQDQDVKLAMILRANSLCHGVSGIRAKIVERYIDLANKNVLPFVQEYGSIGASGDLVPLSAIAGAVLGTSSNFKLKHQGQYHSAPQLLQQLGLSPLSLKPKEGLALINGTSVLTAIAANNCVEMAYLFNIHLHLQVAMCEIMGSDMRSFSEFIQRYRPHPGQKWIASVFRDALANSARVRNTEMVEADFTNNALIQDRYSIRCIPQFLGAIVEDLGHINRSVSVEMNSATDNPLIDPETDNFYHGGNFLGQHMSMAMDKMRICIALLAKHNEAQIASLVEPAFNNGLPASLVPEAQKGRTVGIKPLQILSNSLVPLMEQNANPLCTHFPVHAEQFNQNINSQGFGSALLTRKSIELYRQQLSCFSVIVGTALELVAEQKSKSAQEEFGLSASQLHSALQSICLSNEKTKNTVLTDAQPGQFSHWVAQLNQTMKSHDFGTFSELFQLSSPPC